AHPNSRLWREHEEEVTLARGRFGFRVALGHGFGDSAGRTCAESRRFFFGHSEGCCGRFGFSPTRSGATREFPFFQGSSARDEIGPHQLPAGKKCRLAVERR